MEPALNTAEMFALGGDFSDIDHFSEITRSWNLDFFQLDRGPLEASLFQLGHSYFQLAEARFSRALEQHGAARCSTVQHGAAPTGMRTFAIPAAPFSQLRWRGISISSDHLMIFPRGGELYSISLPGFHVFTYSVREDVLAVQAEQLGHPEMVDFLDSGVEIVHAQPKAMTALAGACRKMIDAGRPATPLPLVAYLRIEDLHERIACRLTKALIGATSPALSPPPPHGRARAIRRARDYVNDRREAAITIRQLCRETGVSVRTLQYAFQDEFNMSPKSWLLARSLKGVRRDLRRAHSSHTKVADIANAWSFWHMGQFAGDYRRMFGELPSQTLAQPMSSNPV